MPTTFPSQALGIADLLVAVGTLLAYNPGLVKRRAFDTIASAVCEMEWLLEMDQFMSMCAAASFKDPYWVSAIGR